MRPGDAYQAVGESLQADVMRFMAIIAFCLIAILALVRSVEPEPPAAQAAATFDAEAHAPLTEQAQSSEPPAPAEVGAVARPVPASHPRVTLVAAPEPVPVEEPAPTAVSKTAPVPRQRPSGGIASPEPLAAGPAEPSSQPEAPAEPSASKTSRQGLSLRFASDRDFLRLVNRGDIRVFAFNERQVLSLQSDFSFQPAAAPGRVHELLPETIPALMSGSLARGHGGAAYRWGIAMPERMARQIRAFVDGGATGELVIDRFGEVRHHEV